MAEFPSLMFNKTSDALLELERVDYIELDRMSEVQLSSIHIPDNIIHAYDNIAGLTIDILPLDKVLMNMLSAIYKEIKETPAAKDHPFWVITILDDEYTYSTTKFLFCFMDTKIYNAKPNIIKTTLIRRFISGVYLHRFTKMQFMHTDDYMLDTVLTNKDEIVDWLRRLLISLEIKHVDQNKFSIAKRHKDWYGKNTDKILNAAKRAIFEYVSNCVTAGVTDVDHIINYIVIPVLSSYHRNVATDILNHKYGGSTNKADIKSIIVDGDKYGLPDSYSILYAVTSEQPD